MTDKPDADLLELFVRDNSGPAFAMLVERHISLVHSVALRHTASPQHAQDITQAVFIILARKAAALNRRTILTGWLYHAARLTAANFNRTEASRIRREQEAFMQSTIQETTPDPLWAELSPLLDEGMSRLGTADRDALVLRYFQNKSLSEVGLAMGLEERTAQKRVTRAVEKLRKFFAQRGVAISSVAIAGAVSANSVQAAPVALAKSVAAVAIAKGAAASASTLTLVKGALKIMAWAKVKTAIVICVGLLIVAGSTIATLKVIQNSSSDALWDTGIYSTNTLSNAPHIVRIIPAKFPNNVFVTDGDRIYGTEFALQEILKFAYNGMDTRTIYLTALPQGKFDYIANLPSGSKEALRQEVKNQFGIVARFTTIETNVLFLKVQSTNAPGLKSIPAQNRPSQTTGTAVASRAAGTNASKGTVYSQNIVGYVIASPPPQTNQSNQTLTFTDQNHQTFPISSLASIIEAQVKIPVIDQTKPTQFTNRSNIELYLDSGNDPQHEKLIQSLSDQLGLELVPGTAPVEFLIVE